MAQAPSIIKYADILPGDTIRATMYEFGAKVERTGKVAYKAEGLRTNDHGNIYRYGWAGDWEFELLDRPKPPLPLHAGAVIIANRITGLGSPHTALSLRHDGWWISLATGKPFSASSIIEWTPAKIVEVSE